MKILHWDEKFHPLYGAQINILPKYQVKQGHEVIIVTAKNVDNHPYFSKFVNKCDIEKEDKLYENKYGVKIIRLPLYGVVSGRVIYKKGYVNKIKEINPDIIMCHGNAALSSIIITKKHKKIGIPIVFDNHMLEMASKNPLSRLFRLYYKHFITPIIKKNEWIVIRTQDDDYVNKYFGIPRKLTPFISFGTDTSLFYPDNQKRLEFRKKHDISNDDFVVIYTGKLSKEKNGKLLANAFKKRFEIDKKVVLVVVGNAVSDYAKEVEDIFSETENRIIRFPTQNYVDLPVFYQMANLSVFPKQCSLSFYDAQACGLPVIAEDNNVNAGRLSHENGVTFKPGDLEDFRNKILRFATMGEKEYNRFSRNAYSFVKNEYDYEDIALAVTDILISEYKRHSRKS